MEPIISMAGAIPDPPHYFATVDFYCVSEPAYVSQIYDMNYCLSYDKPEGEE
jgi:hypothetical protein